MRNFLKKTGYWLIILLVTDAVFIFLVWLMRPDALIKAGMFIGLFTAVSVVIGALIQHYNEKKQIKALDSFVESADEKTVAELILQSGAAFERPVYELYEKITAQTNSLNDSKLALDSYREFIEAWTHEIKTPVSLTSLVLENRRDEISPYVALRLEYALQQFNDNIGKILYYARLQSKHPDVSYSRFNLTDCINEVRETFDFIAKEKNIEFIVSVEPIEAVSDKNAVSFALSQLVSNAIKYADKNSGRISVTATLINSVHKNELNKASVTSSFDDTCKSSCKNKIMLSVRDNGKGVPPQDLPFIFDKGFTGSSPDRGKATGMGLYLVKKIADELSAEVMVLPPDKEYCGFGIAIVFSVC